MIGGRVANVYRPTIRFTTDYDFLVRRLDGLRVALEAEGFEIRKAPLNQDGALLQIVAVRDGVRYDFNLADYEYQFEALERARANDGILVVEDLLIHKLLAWRDQDRKDLFEIVRAGVPFDRDLVRRWCEVFEITANLDRLLEVGRDHKVGDDHQLEC